VLQQPIQRTKHHAALANFRVWFPQARPDWRPADLITNGGVLQGAPKFLYSVRCDVMAYRHAGGVDKVGGSVVAVMANVCRT
jgi:hypothetical protein